MIDSFHIHLICVHALLLVPTGLIAGTLYPVIQGTDVSGGMTSELTSSITFTIKPGETIQLVTAQPHQNVFFPQWQVQTFSVQAVSRYGISISDNFISFSLVGENGVAWATPISLDAHYNTHLFTAHFASSFFEPTLIRGNRSSFANTGHVLHSLVTRELLFSTPTGWIRDSYTVTGALYNPATGFQGNPATLTGCFGLATAVGPTAAVRPTTTVGPTAVGNLGKEKECVSTTIT
jgi:hypothetical protein